VAPFSAVVLRVVQVGTLTGPCISRIPLVKPMHLLPNSGRYPIHFHLIGEVPMSYALGNSVHKSFNRAFTIHGTKYLRLIDNVAFDTKGHTIFIEDGIERRNLV